MIGKYVGEPDPFGNLINDKEYIILGRCWDGTVYDVIDETGDNFLYPAEDFEITQCMPWEKP